MVVAPDEDSRINAMVWLAKQWWGILQRDIFMICGDEDENWLSPGDLTHKLKEAASSPPPDELLWSENDIKSTPTTVKGTFLSYLIILLQRRQL